MNDVLLCAYAQTLHSISAANAVTIPCPVNLRSYLQKKPSWSIANFVGDFQVTLHGLDHRDWRELLADVHQQMQEEKARCSDLHTIQLLHPIMKHLPLAVTKAVAKAGFHSPEISYTNLGKIDAASIYFDDCTITQLYLLGRARIYPSFQTISLYMEGYLYLSLSCHRRHVTANACTEILTTMCRLLHTYAGQPVSESKTRTDLCHSVFYMQLRFHFTYPDTPICYVKRPVYVHEVLLKGTYPIAKQTAAASIKLKRTYSMLSFHLCQLKYCLLHQNEIES